MELVKSKCPSCGGGVTFEDGVQTSICEYCGNEYLAESSKKLAGLEDYMASKLKNLRQLQTNAAKKNDIKTLVSSSAEILKIVADDYLSEYYYAYAQNEAGQNGYLQEFYQSVSKPATISDINKILHHLHEYSDLRDKLEIEGYIMCIYHKDVDNFEELLKYQEEFEKRRVKEDDYANIPRDIFVCYRSTNRELAENIVKTLEEDGNTCWISYRNLRPNDSKNYWESIREAVSSCQIFLVISDQGSMLSKDCNAEINIAKALKKQPIEYKIDTSLHTTFFKAFFDGIAWVDAFSNIGNPLEQLCRRIFQEKEKLNRRTEKRTKDYVSESNEGLLENLILKAEMLLEEGNFKEAQEVALEITNKNIKCAEGWWIAFLANNKIADKNNLLGMQINLTNDINYLRFLRFASTELKVVNSSYVDRAFENLNAKIKKEEAKAKISAKVETKKNGDREIDTRGLSSKEIFDIGNKYYYGIDTPQDLNTAVKYYAKAADLGNMYAQFCLGFCYCTGEGVSQNYDKAIELYKKSATQNYVEAEYSLGVCYTAGCGVGKDNTKAVEWFKKAALQGHPGAQYNLAASYKRGCGIEKNLKKAVEWFTKASKAGDVNAQFSLGHCYYHGEGVDKSFETAAMWFKKSSEQGLSDAQYYLAHCYEFGNGVPKNNGQAFEWYRKAAEQGHVDAQKRFNTLIGR